MVIPTRAREEIVAAAAAQIVVDAVAPDDVITAAATSVLDAHPSDTVLVVQNAQYVAGDREAASERLAVVGVAEIAAGAAAIQRGGTKIDDNVDLSIIDNLVGSAGIPNAAEPLAVGSPLVGRLGYVVSVIPTGERRVGAIEDLHRGDIERHRRIDKTEPRVRFGRMHIRHDGVDNVVEPIPGVETAFHAWKDGPWRGGRSAVMGMFQAERVTDLVDDVDPGGAIGSPIRGRGTSSVVGMIGREIGVYLSQVSNLNGNLRFWISQICDGGICILREPLIRGSGPTGIVSNRRHRRIVDNDLSFIDIKNLTEMNVRDV
jgi:hypothetical protein